MTSFSHYVPLFGNKGQHTPVRGRCQLYFFICELFYSTQLHIHPATNQPTNATFTLTTTFTLTMPLNQPVVDVQRPSNGVEAIDNLAVW